MAILSELDIDLKGLVPGLWGDGACSPVQYLELPDFEYRDFTSWERFELCRMDWIVVPACPWVVPLELAASPHGDKWAVLIPELVDEGYPDGVLLVALGRFESLHCAAQTMFRRAVLVLMGQDLCVEPDCWEQRSEALLSLDELQKLWAEESDKYWDQ